MVFLAALLPLLAGSAAAASLGDRSLNATAVCRVIAKAVSSTSAVYYPGSDEYKADVNHWAASSSEESACSVQPGAAKDISIILGIVGASRTPFAVKGGGHVTNIGYSSTKGVHISLKRFKDVVYDSKTSTATIGAGLIWNEVYSALEPHGVNVVGGRTGNVGVAGFTLGGGYSWLTNQHGLAVDTVVSFELVTPNSGVKTVTQKSDPDLFFALKGGFNNFGIVTKFTFKAFPQGQVWGGIRYVLSNETSALSAIERFSRSSTDPKAAIISSVAAANQPGVPAGVGLLLLQLFYNAPTPPAGLFDELLAVPAFMEDVSTRSFFSLVATGDSSAQAGLRTIFNTVGIPDYSVEFLQTVINETLSNFATLSPRGLILISYAVEPFLDSALSHSNSPTAYPASRSTVYRPTNIYFSWIDPSQDAIMTDAIRATKRALDAKAAELGQDVANAKVYGNYALAGTPLKDIYGDNLPRLRSIRKRVDPFNIMTLAGGWKFV